MSSSSLTMPLLRHGVTKTAPHVIFGAGAFASSGVEMMPHPERLEIDEDFVAIRVDTKLSMVESVLSNPDLLRRIFRYIADELPTEDTECFMLELEDNPRSRGTYEAVARLVRPILTSSEAIRNLILVNQVFKQSVTENNGVDVVKQLSALKERVGIFEGRLNKEASRYRRKKRIEWLFAVLFICAVIGQLLAIPLCRNDQACQNKLAMGGLVSFLFALSAIFCIANRPKPEVWLMRIQSAYAMAKRSERFQLAFLGIEERQPEEQVLGTVDGDVIHII